MTLHPLDPHPLVEAVAGVHASLDHMALEAWKGLEASQVRRLTEEIGRAEARLAAQKMAAARALEVAGTARQVGATSTGNLLAQDFGGDDRAGRRVVQTAKKLESTRQTETALARGEITFDQSEVIASGLSMLPADVSESQRDLAERTLLKDAQRLNLRDLRRRTDRLMDVYASKPEVDAREDELLVTRERKARQGATFSMWDKRDGTHGFRGEIPSAEAVMLKTALDALAAPSRAHLSDPEATLGPVPEDLGDPARRMGRAFTDLCSHLPIDGLPSNGGVGAQVVVTLTYDALVGGVEPATLSDGARLSAGQARKLACRAGIIPVVLDGEPSPSTTGRRSGTSPGTSDSRSPRETGAAPSPTATGRLSGPRLITSPPT